MADQTRVMLLTILLVITIPITLSIWLLSLFTGGPIAGLASNTPLRWFFSLLFPLFIATRAFRKGSVDLSGAIVGFLITFILSFANFSFLGSFFMFFFSSNIATKYKGSVKLKIEADYEKSSRRNWIQAICNVGVAGQVALLYLIDNGKGSEAPLDFQHQFTGTYLALFVLGSIACAAGDTFASEIGSVLSKNDPFLITTLRRVPRGTNGAISLVGCVVSASGGLLVGITYYIVMILFVDSKTLSMAPNQLPIILISTLAGLAGSTVDSILGAIFQYSGLNTKTGKIAEKPGNNVKWITGFNVLDNHSVNLLSTLITGFLTASLTSNFFFD